MKVRIVSDAWPKALEDLVGKYDKLASGYGFEALIGLPSPRERWPADAISLSFLARILAAAEPLRAPRGAFNPDRHDVAMIILEPGQAYRQLEVDKDHHTLVIRFVSVTL